MKVLGNLTVPKDINTRYPFDSNIKNETDTEQGTPVIREIYGDPLMNMYKILELVGVVPTNTEDSDDTQYQLVDALKKLPNSLNDIEQTLTLTGTVWSVPFNLTYLPNKYFFIARATENYVSTETYTFKGSGVLELPFSSIGGFNATDELLVIIDNSGVRAYSLTKLMQAPTEIFTFLGSPLAFNDTDVMYYKEDGFLLSDLPSSSDLQLMLRTFSSNGALLLNDVILHDNKLVCICFDPNTNSYSAFDFDINDLNIIEEVGLFPNDSDIDYMPFSYFDIDGNLFMTNKGNGNSGINDYEVSKYTRDVFGVFQFVSMVSLDASFVKTTNAVIKNNYLYTFESSYLNRFNLSTGVKETILYLPGVNGQIFQFNGNIYFTSGEVAKLWTI